MLEGVIKRLSELQLNAALEGTLRPMREGDMAFNYGLACGRVLAFKEALEVIEEALSAEESRG